MPIREYDAVGNLTNITYPTNHPISMAYDMPNRLISMVVLAMAIASGQIPKDESNQKSKLRSLPILEAVAIVSCGWFLLSQWINNAYMEAADPPDPGMAGPGGLLRAAHVVTALPFMRLLPMNWLHAHWGPVAATRTVVVALAVNSVFWGCSLVAVVLI